MHSRQRYSRWKVYKRISFNNFTKESYEIPIFSEQEEEMSFTDDNDEEEEDSCFPIFRSTE